MHIYIFELISNVKHPWIIDEWTGRVPAEKSSAEFIDQNDKQPIHKPKHLQNVPAKGIAPSTYDRDINNASNSYLNARKISSKYT